MDSPISIDIQNINISPMDDNDSSDDGLSISSLLFSGDSEQPGISTNVTRKRKATKHSETKYYMAGPAPTMLQKQRFVHIRPRTVLQLQKLPRNGRATPILDIKSSNTFVPRIAKKFPSLYKGSGQLGINDVMICKSESYDDDVDEEVLAKTPCGTEKWDEKEVIAVICQAPKDSGYSGELVFDDGSRWTMAAGTRGKSFELTKTDTATGEKVVARWVPAGTSRRSSFHTPVTKKAIGAAEMAKEAKEAKPQKYNFSLVDPTKRRHPVMATLRQTGLVVKDTYSPITDSPTNSSSTLAVDAVDAVDATVDTGAQDSAVEAGPSGYPSLSDPPVIRTTVQQKLLIEISAMWLASRLGWCPWPDPTHILPTLASSSKSTPSSKSAGRQRSSTMTPSGSAKHKRARSGTVGSIAEGAVDDTTTLEPNKGSLSKRSGNIFKRSSLNNGIFQSDSEHSPPRLAPKRSVSTGAAFMAKQAEKRASRPPSEAGSRPGSTSVSRNNSRPSSPKRACSMDLLTSLGRDVRHGEALSRGLRKYQLAEDDGRNSVGAFGASPGIRRTQSDFTTLERQGSVVGSPHIKIGADMVPEVTPNPLLVAGQGEDAKMGRRESSYIQKSTKVGTDDAPTRSKSVPSKKSKPQGLPSPERGPKKKVSKMKLFIGLFSKTQRRKNEGVEEERGRFQG